MSFLYCILSRRIARKKRTGTSRHGSRMYVHPSVVFRPCTAQKTGNWPASVAYPEIEFRPSQTPAREIVKYIP